MNAFQKTRFAIGLVGILFVALSNAVAQQVSSLSTIAIVLVGDGEGKTVRMAPAVAMRSTGVLLVPLDAVKDAKEVQVRLQSGEIFDNVSLISSDARRNVATIKIRGGAELTFVDSPNMSDLKAGEKLSIISHLPESLWSKTSGSVLGVKMADEIEGAGQGYRVLHFAAELPAGIGGAVILNDAGTPVAIMTSELSAPATSGYAVPIVSVKDLAESEGTKSFESGKNLTIPKSLDALKLARNPSSDPKDLLLASKKIYVDSNTSMFKQAQLITELKKRKEINDLGWVFLDTGWDSRNKSDLIIQLDHQVLTFDFTFTITHRKTSIVLASGKAIIADGASGSKKMGDEIVKSVLKLTGAKPSK